MPAKIVYLYLGMFLLHSIGKLLAYVASLLVASVGKFQGLVAQILGRVTPDLLAISSNLAQQKR